MTWTASTDSLSFREGTSDKVYFLNYLDDGATFYLVRTWGRRGQTNLQKKVEQFGTHTAALAQVTKHRSAKVREGYVYLGAKTHSPEAAEQLAQAFGLTRGPAFTPPDDLPKTVSLNLTVLLAGVDEYRSSVNAGKSERAALLRPTIHQQLEELRTLVAKIEGEVEITDVLLGAAIAL